MKQKYSLCLFFISYSFVNLSCAQDRFRGSVNPDLHENLETIGEYYHQIKKRLRPSRDPFSYTDAMRRNRKKSADSDTEINESNEVSGGITAVSRSSYSDDGMPIMKFRGYTESSSGEAFGLFEIKGMGVYTVRKGDSIGLHEVVSELVLTIVEINRHNIIVTVGKLGKKMVIQ